MVQGFVMARPAVKGHSLLVVGSLVCSETRRKRFSLGGERSGENEETLECHLSQVKLRRAYLPLPCPGLTRSTAKWGFLIWKTFEMMNVGFGAVGQKVSCGRTFL